MSHQFDALVVGGGVEGLVGAALLAKAGLRVQLLERSAILFGFGGGMTLSAFDPQVVKALDLGRYGLGFATRDLSLTALHHGGPGAVIGRDRHATARSLAALSQDDARAYAPFRRELFALARALRPAWWDGRAVAEVLPRLKPRQRALFDRLAVTSACAFLAAGFESESMRAALAFAAADCGAAPSEPGSALALLWAAAQEMSGLQGAVAIPKGGVTGLLRALSAAAESQGVELRTASTVSRITTARGAVTGVELANGEAIAAPRVLSALTRRRTLLDLLPTGAIGLGAARALARPRPALGPATLLFTLSRAADLATGTRIVVAERTELYEAGLAALRQGQLATEPVLEIVVAPPSADATLPPMLTVRAWPVAAADGHDALLRIATAALERQAPGFAETVTHCEVLEPSEGEPFSVARLLAAAADRIRTPVEGLLLCGVDAEPVEAISGGAARHAAALAQAMKVRLP